MDLLDAAEAEFMDISAPSRLGSTLFSACASAFGVDADDQTFGIAAGAALMGYACRLATPARELPEAMADAITAQLVFVEESELDYDAMAEDSDRFGKLLEYTATLADDVAAIAALLDASPGAWQAFATTATYQLHRNLAANGVPKRALPSGEALENLLRLGCAIRKWMRSPANSPFSRRSPRRCCSSGTTGRFRAGRSTRTSGCGMPQPSAPASSRRSSSDCSSSPRSTAWGSSRWSITCLGKSPASRSKTTSSWRWRTLASATRCATARSNCSTPATVPRARTRSPPCSRSAWAGRRRSNVAVVHGVLRDVFFLEFEGGRPALYSLTPGTTPERRQRAIERWASEHFAGDDPRTGHDVTVDLVEYGYFLHRLFEICPDCLEDWS